MSGDNEPLIPRRDDPLFPITNRRAPILERIRERRGRGNTVGSKAASEMADLALFASDEERSERAEKIQEEFISTLSNELGVPEEAINGDLVNEFTALFVALSEEDMVDREMLERDSTDSDEEDDEEDDDGKSDSPFG